MSLIGKMKHIAVAGLAALVIGGCGKDEESIQVTSYFSHQEDVIRIREGNFEREYVLREHNEPRPEPRRSCGCIRQPIYEYRPCLKY